MLIQEIVIKVDVWINALHHYLVIIQQINVKLHVQVTLLHLVIIQFIYVLLHVH